jgi:hypothetical protein
VRATQRRDDFPQRKYRPDDFSRSESGAASSLDLFFYKLPDAPEGVLLRSTGAQR